MRLVLRSLLLLLACAGIALATKPALRLERIDPSQFVQGGKVRVFASLVELEGQVDDDKGAQSFRLLVDGRGSIAPEHVEPFRIAAVPLDLVLVIESSALYGVQKLPPPVPIAPKSQSKKGHAPLLVPTPLPTGEVPLDHVKAAMATLLEGRPAKTRVLVVDYGGDVTRHPPFRPATAAGGALDDLSPDDESGDLHLVDAVRAALVELQRSRASADEPARQLIVVVSDGLNAQMDRNTFRALGDAAATAHVPIHAVAFTPADERGPLLNLGEISKRSNGTFRWARSAEDLKAQIETLADELDKQYVLTFSLSLDKLDGHTFQLACESLRSNLLRYDADGGMFTASTARRSTWWRWVGGILGGLITIYLLLALLLRVAARRSPVLLIGARRIRLDPDRVLILGKALIDDPAVSTQHAELRFDGRGWLVRDLGSTNGTLIDGVRINEPTYLQPGVILQLGQSQLILKL